VDTLPPRPSPVQDLARLPAGPLYCTCCGQRVLAVWEPPDRLIIRARPHGQVHILQLQVCVEQVPEKGDKLHTRQ
jgi:hypothetical protein